MAFGRVGGGVGGGGAGSLVGAPPSNWEAAYGGRPRVPNPVATGAAALGGNIGNLGSIYQITGGINDASQSQMLENLARGLPNYQALTAQSSANIGSNLRGQLPGDVLDQILQGAAERGIITGTMGSQNADAAMLRALGLTSLDLTRLGEEQLTGAIGRTPQAPLLDPSRLLITPQDQQEAQMAANLYASAPNPGDAARAARSAARSGFRSGLGSVGGAPVISAGPSSAGQWGSWTDRPSWESQIPMPQSYGMPGTAPADTGSANFGLGGGTSWGGGYGGGTMGGGAGSRWFAEPFGGYWDLDTGDWSEYGNYYSGTEEGYTPPATPGYYAGSAEGYYE